MGKMHEGIKIWFAACLQRDKHTCQICGAEAVDVHHIVHKSGINRLLMDNGISLCRCCHMMDGHPTSCQTFRIKCVEFMGADRYEEVKRLSNTCAPFDRDEQINELKMYLKEDV